MTIYKDPIKPDWDSLKLPPLKVVKYLQIATLRAAHRALVPEIQHYGGPTEIQLDGVDFVGRFTKNEMKRIKRKIAETHDRLIDQFTAGGFSDAMSLELGYISEDRDDVTY